VVLLLTDEQRAFQDVAQRFAREKLAPHYQAREREGVIDRALVREMGSLGLIAPDLQEQHGGIGAPSETTGVIIEALAWGDFNVAYVQLLGSLCGQGWRDTHRPISHPSGCRRSSRARAFLPWH
jgi:cyclohexanecarboxyl-CoA dehydrogenase